MTRAQRRVLERLRQYIPLERWHPSRLYRFRPGMGRPTPVMASTVQALVEAGEVIVGRQGSTECVLLALRSREVASEDQVDDP